MVKANLAECSFPDRSRLSFQGNRVEFSSLGMPRRAPPVNRTEARLCSGLPDSLKTRGRTLRATVGGALTARHRLADLQG